MEQAWDVTVWGVRGSFPRAQREFLEYGGNTTCLSVDCGDALIILDAGSGLACLGERISRSGGPKRVDILLSHLHLDHVLGLVSFLPLHNPAMEIHLYGASGMAEELARLVEPPYWPVSLDNCQAQVKLHEIGAGPPFLLAGGAAEGLTVTALEGCHPNGSFLYRLERRGRSLVHALDCELQGEMAGRLTAFAQGADLLVWDASFTPDDWKSGWGHSTWAQGIALRQAAGAKKVLMTHYSWDYTDEFLRTQERLAGQKDAASSFAKEGMKLWI